MHDPMTVAFTIPWRYKTQTWPNGDKWRYWEPLITIWHVDPEKDGSDDSCGWFRPKPTKTVREIAKSLAGDEAREPWFMATEAKRIDVTVEGYAGDRGVWWSEYVVPGEEGQAW